MSIPETITPRANKSLFISGLKVFAGCVNLLDLLVASRGGIGTARTPHLFAVASRRTPRFCMRSGAATVTAHFSAAVVFPQADLARAPSFSRLIQDPRWIAAFMPLHRRNVSSFWKFHRRRILLR